MATPARNTDLRHVRTGVTLSHAERTVAELRHQAARNDVRLKIARRKVAAPKVVIGAAWLPAAVTRAFTYVAVGGTR